MSIIKRIAAIFIGIMLATLVITLMEKLGHSIYPVPDDVDPTKPEDIKRMMANAPTAALTIVTIGYAIAAFLGAMVAQLISNGRRIWSGSITGFMLLVFVIANLYSFPHPTWMITTSILGVMVGALLGSLLARTRKVKSL